MLGYIDNSFAIAGRVPFPMIVRIRDEIMARTRAALGPVDCERQITAGAALTEEQALSLAFDEVDV